MGYKKVPIIYTLDGPGGRDGLIVRMKSMKIGQMRKIVRMLDDDDLDTSVLLDEMVKQVGNGLVSWNMEYPDDHELAGQPIPATPDEVDQLDFDELKDILTEWLDQVTGPGEDLGKDSSSGERFPGQPLTMEAL